jgi:hypothetical protein
VGLGDSDRQTIAAPRFEQHRSVSAQADFRNAHGSDVSLPLASVPAMRRGRMAIEPMIEEAIAGDVIVQSHDRRRRRTFEQPCELIAIRAGTADERCERMFLVHVAGEQIETDPASMIFEPRLLAHFSCRTDQRGIFGLHELGVRHAHPNCGHRVGDGAALVQERAVTNARSSRRWGYQTPYSAENRAVVNGSLIGVYRRIQG